MEVGNTKVDLGSTNNPTSVDTSSSISSGSNTNSQTMGEFFNQLYEERAQSDSQSTSTDVETSAVDEMDLSSFADDSTNLSSPSSIGGTLRETASNIASDVQSLMQKIGRFFNNLGESIARTSSQVAETVTSKINDLLDKLEGKQEQTVEEEILEPVIEEPIIIEETENDTDTTDTILEPDLSEEETITDDTSGTEQVESDETIDTEIETETLEPEEGIDTEIESTETIIEEIEDKPLIINGVEIPTDRPLNQAEMEAIKADARRMFEKMIADNKLTDGTGLNVSITPNGITVNELGNVMIELSDNGKKPSTMQIIYNARNVESLENIVTYVQGDTGGEYTDTFFLNKIFPRENDHVFVSVKSTNEAKNTKYSNVAMKFLNTLADNYDVTYKTAELSGWSQGAFDTGVFFNSLVTTLDNSEDIQINIRLFCAKEEGKYFRNFLRSHSDILQKMIDRRVVVYAYEEEGIGGGGNANLESNLGEFVDKGLMVVKIQNASLPGHEHFVCNVDSRDAEGNNIRNNFEEYDAGPYSNSMRYSIVEGLGNRVIGSTERVTVQELASLIRDYKDSATAQSEDPLQQKGTLTQLDSESQGGQSSISEVSTEVTAAAQAIATEVSHETSVETQHHVEDTVRTKSNGIWEAGYTVDCNYVASNGTKCVVIKKNDAVIDENSLMYVCLPDGGHNHSIEGYHGASTDYLVTLANKKFDFGHDVIVIPTGDYVANANNVNKYRDAVNEIADANGIGKYVVAGESAGGDSAIQWALMYPNDERLVAVDAIANSGITMGSNTQGRGMGNATPEQQQALANSHIKIRIFPLRYNAGTIFDKWINEYHPSNVIMAKDENGNPKYFKDGNGRVVAYTEEYFNAPGEMVKSENV